MADLEIAVIGGGVVGLAIAARLSQKHPGIVVLEKNEKYGMETSSRNSEVIHAGIYYAPGSLKARLCVEGRNELYALCAAHNIPHAKITKLISASTEAETAKLDAIAANAAKNGVLLERLDRKQTLALEPHINTCGSLFSPMTGIISVHSLMDYFHHTILSNGGMVQERCRVTAIEPAAGGYRIVMDEQGERSELAVEIVINAAGLESDTVAAMAGIDVDAAGYRLAYAKGSYFAVTATKAKLISRLVYPVPHDEGLGVHALLDLGGRLKFGPDIEYLPGRALDYTVDESKRSAFAASIRRILPVVTDDDVVPDMSGIRPKLQRKGERERDFVIVHETERGLRGFVNLVGIDSPGLTSSPAIARTVDTLLFG